MSMSQPRVDDEQAEVVASSAGVELVPVPLHGSNWVERSPSGVLRVDTSENVLLRLSGSGRIKYYERPTTPLLASPRSEGQSTQQQPLRARSPPRCRRPLVAAVKASDAPSTSAAAPTAVPAVLAVPSTSAVPPRASSSTSPVAGTSVSRKRTGSSVTASSSSSAKMPRSSRVLSLRDIELAVNDSGSEADSDDDFEDDEFALPTVEEAMLVRENQGSLRRERFESPERTPEEHARYMREEWNDEEYIRSLIEGLRVENEVHDDLEGDRAFPMDVEEGEAAVSPLTRSASPPAVKPRVRGARRRRPRGAPAPAVAPEYVFDWSDDFHSNFTGQPETYLRSPGPQISLPQDPTEVFLKIWDRPIVETIVAETNRYASQEHAGWLATTVQEIYVYLAMLIYMSICLRTDLHEYWTTDDVLGMPGFRSLMSRDRFKSLSRFLHFISNDDQPPGLSSYEKKIFKISPILNHCNNIFPSLYTPERELSLDESLLLWKGRLPFVQSIRTKAARFGIKSYDLCEASSGYVLRTLLYAGKDASMHPTDIHGFKKVTPKTVLKLLDGYLDLGHCVYMDNWYNQMPLTRYLKSRSTDVVGTMNRSRLHVPVEMKSLKQRSLERGQQVARHCGDITLISWMYVKLVTGISTFHNADQVPAKRAGQDIMKPLLIRDYNEYMGGVDRKDQMMSMFLIERKRKRKWYIKVFHRLVKTSLLNTYFLSRRNVAFRNLTHREVRITVARGLVHRFRCPRRVQTATRPPTAMAPPSHRLDDHQQHFPMHSECKENSKKKRQRRCVRCTFLGKRTSVVSLCSRCGVPLCLGKCWLEYHTLENLNP